MTGIANASRVIFAILGLPLTGFGLLFLINSMTSDGAESWGDLLASMMMLPMGALCMIAAFVAQLVVNADEFH